MIFSRTRAVARIALAYAAFSAAPSHAILAQDNRPDVVIDAAAREQAIENLARETTLNYVDSAMASRIAAELRRNLKAGHYAQTSARELARILTTELRALSGDQHFLVDYFVVPRAFNVAEPAVDPLSEAQRKRAIALQNFGFERVERMAGNVGYLRLDHFEDPALTGDVLAAAMQFLSGTDALIVDLRSNGGGYASAVTLLESYFLEEATHVGDHFGRSSSDFRQTWTYPTVAGRKYLNKPVFVLTGPRTFSAAEALAYDLQALKRAQIVGETTRGGANPSTRLLLSPRFGVIMPIARTVSAVTGSNWEGGLKPDIAVTAERALDSAHLRALQSIAPLHTDDPLTQEIDRTIAALSSAVAATSPRTP